MVMVFSLIRANVTFVPSLPGLVQVERGSIAVIGDEAVEPAFKIDVSDRGVPGDEQDAFNHLDRLIHRVPHIWIPAASSCTSALNCTERPSASAPPEG